MTSAQPAAKPTRQPAMLWLLLSDWNSTACRGPPGNCSTLAGTQAGSRLSSL